VRIGSLLELSALQDYMESLSWTMLQYLQSMPGTSFQSWHALVIERRVAHIGPGHGAERANGGLVRVCML
jgi:hypothetical protein